MAQLRHDYPAFQSLNTEIIVMVPNGPRMIARHISANETPYLVLTDKGARVAAQYFQVKQFFLAGTPTVLLVDRSGQILYAHYASSVIEEPGNEQALAILRQQAA